MQRPNKPEFERKNQYWQYFPLLRKSYPPSSTPSFRPLARKRFSLLEALFAEGIVGPASIGRRFVRYFSVDLRPVRSHGRQCPD